MNNLIVDEKYLEKIVTILNEFIDEIGLSSSLKVVIIEAENNLDKKRRTRRDYGKFKVKTSPYIEDVKKMLLDGMSYADISNFLKSEGESISKASIGRYAQSFFDSLESDNSPEKGGAF
ncbi:MAG: Bacteriophage Mu, Gp27 [Candidatus Petromonas sp.]|jgi:hypothetical protein|nr:Bacteriophage Mu, Gp27 [Thermoanaerobacterium sp.]MDK2919168.1 Bacteriophage Mu, Gp27 [Candidatus Petromonas sp.]